MKAVEIQLDLVKKVRYACLIGIEDEACFMMLDIDWLETRVSEIIWHNVLWPLRNEIEEDDEQERR